LFRPEAVILSGAVCTSKIYTYIIPYILYRLEILLPANHSAVDLQPRHPLAARCTEHSDSGSNGSHSQNDGNNYFPALFSHVNMHYLLYHLIIILLHLFKLVQSGTLMPKICIIRNSFIYFSLVRTYNIKKLLMP